ncbi:MAG: RNA polymerase sigma factor [Opitutus sp.]|nr:RNA polymerase sigma factor [Opitutus sp.]
MSNSAPRPEPAPDSDHGRWFKHEVHAHDAQLKSYLRGSFPTVRDVDDVVQESYLRVWKARLTQPIHSAKSFLFQVARHLAIDLIRRERASPVDVLPDLGALSVLDDRPGVVEIACTHEEIASLARAFDALPARCREVMMLRQIQGIPQKEIARRLGLSVLTVQTHVVHGLRRLEAFLHWHAREWGQR